MTDKTKLMRQIQMYDFAVQEAALFLDSHPNNKKALEYYRKNRDLRSQAVTAFQEKYGPITLNGVWSDDRWTWVTTAWPWETEE